MSTTADKAVRVRRAQQSEADLAFAIVREYYEAARVVVKDDFVQFRKDYFGKGAGVWLAYANSQLAGCIALRPLLPKSGPSRSKRAAEGGHEAIRPSVGEIKRLYVRPQFRGRGIAKELLTALEEYARRCGYSELRLDTAASMLAAAQLYRSCGYEERERYNDNPQAAFFMKKTI